MADIGGVQGIFSKMGMPTAPSTFSPANLLTNDTKVAVQGIDQTTGAKKTVKLAKTDVKPITGQSNDTPTAASTPPPDSVPFNDDAYRNGSSTLGNEGLVPRTLNGDEEVIASMTLRRPSNGTDPDLDLIDSYSRFFLESVTEAEQEKYQVVETFTGYYAFFYGKRPPIYRYSGTLLCDVNYRWNNDFKFAYENFFRGTSAVELLAEVVMTYDGRVVIGFPLSLTMQQNAMNPKGMPFSMDLLVVEHTKMDFSIDVDGLIQLVAANLAAEKAKIQRTQQSLVTGGGPSTSASDQATNGLKPPSALSLPGAPSGFSGVSQRLVSGF